MTSCRNRIGVDIGGTFTDVVLEGAVGRFSVKLLTTHTAPEDAIIAGIKSVSTRAGVGLSSIGQIIHGTTLATNALIERRGARTAFVTTLGFRDVIEMRTESRFEQYDLNLSLPDPLLPRDCRYVVGERLDSAGDILHPLAEAEVEALADVLGAQGYESIAVGLLHSYANNVHEQMIRRIFERRLPHVMVSLSSEVSPQMREYERFNTTIANAYIKPLMKSYLSRLKTRLMAESINCPTFLMHSGGGIISLDSAAEFPVRLVESGPAGGAVFAAHIAASHGLDKVLSFDMGGTTAKICLIKDATPKTARVFEVARTYRFKKGSGMPISIPVIDMVEIGAGGGSLAGIDSLRRIGVGPESAGSEPGPACYGRGGLRPAVTDADLVLGKLTPEHFAGGSIHLDSAAAEAAISAHIGGPLAMDSVEAAWGIAEVVDENMANAARVHGVENGEDLSTYTMIAFGGAAPLHAGRLAEKLGIKRLLIPSGAGVGSAIGFLKAPFSFEANRSIFMTLDAFDAEKTRQLFADMESEARSFVRLCDAEAAIETSYKIYMRYTGQGWEIPVTLTAAEAMAGDAGLFKTRFEDSYQQLFGRTVSGMAVEITVWSVAVATKALAPQRIAKSGASASAQTEIQRPIFDPALGKTVVADIYERTGLKSGQHLQGPAAIIEDETTIIVPTSRMARVCGDGTIGLITKDASHD